MAYFDVVPHFEHAMFCLGLALNCFLLHCILHRTKYDLGMYKYMQLTFVSVDVAYAVAEVTICERFITQPGILAMVSLGAFSNSKFALVPYLSLYSVIFVIMDYNFLYRLWALRSPNKIRFFSQAWFILLLVIAALFECVLWGSTLHVFLVPSERGRVQIRQATWEKYGVDSMRAPMLMADYFSVCAHFVVAGPYTENKMPTRTHMDPTRKMQMYANTLFDQHARVRLCESGALDVRLLLGVSIMFIVMVICFGFMVYAAADIVRHLADASYASSKTLCMQRQLFTALVSQTLIPFVLLYLPCGFNLGLPVLIPLLQLPLDISWSGDLSPLPLAVFFPLDAAAVLYLIKDYRAAAANVLTCGRRNRRASTVVFSLSMPSNFASTNN